MMFECQLSATVRGWIRAYAPIRGEMALQRPVVQAIARTISRLALVCSVPTIEKAIAIPISGIEFNNVRKETPVLGDVSVPIAERDLHLLNGTRTDVSYMFRPGAGVHLEAVLNGRAFHRVVHA